MNTIINEKTASIVEVKRLKDHVTPLARPTMALLSDWEVDYGDEGVMSNLNEWARNKNELYSVMRKSPHWNEKLLSIVADFEYEPTIDQYDVNNIIDNILWNIGYPFRAHFCNYVGRASTEITLTSDFTTTLNNLISQCYPESKLRFSEGQKTTRAMRKLFLLGGAKESNKDFVSLFNRYAESMDTSPKKSKIILSIHPHPYLLMSNGNQWSSCHNLNGDSDMTDKNCGGSYNHCYRRGTLSYMNDSPTFIVYGLSRLPADEDAILTTPKNFRQAFHVGFNETDDGLQGMLMMQSRLYPWGNENPLSTAIRSIVCALMTECAGIKNKRLRKRGYEGFFQDEASHYADYEHSTYGSSVLKFGDVDPFFAPRGSIGIGSTPYCLECGCNNSDNGEGELSCGDCSDGYGNSRCDRCGDRENEDDMYYIEDRDENWCESCYERHATACAYCGNYVSNSDTREVDGDDWCSNCVENSGAWLCDGCGEYHSDNVSAFEYANGRGFTCAYGVSDTEFVCQDCNEVFESDDDDGDGYCPACTTKEDEGEENEKEAA